MKKSTLMGLLVYALMIGGVAVVVFTIIRPLIMNNATSAPMNSIIFILLAFVAGVVGTALVLELGHLIGAKLGGYKVTSWTCLGFRFKRNSGGKMKFGFGGFDGLTGETKVVPKDIQKSNPRRIIYTPLFLFLLEVIGLVVWCVAAQHFEDTWGYIFAVVVLTVGCAIFLYEIFPATLDAKNDGQYLGVFSNQTNVEAYNRILVNEDLVARGQPIDEEMIFTDVTNFTVKMNNTIMFDAVKKGDYEKALGILELTIACKDKVSDSIYNEAVAIKTAIIILTKPEEEAKEFYIALPHLQKKYIAGIPSEACRAAYILISTVIEESSAEVEIALRNCEVGYRIKDGETLTASEDLVVLAIKKAYELHPDWDFSEYEFPKTEEKPEAPAESEGEQKPENEPEEKKED